MKKKLPFVVLAALLVVGLSVFAWAKRRQPDATSQGPAAAKKIGVLLISHGSRSATWRASLTALEERVRQPIVQGGRVLEVKTAFMEYTEPSIATRLKEFDAEGFSDVILVPVFLTVSPHTFDDIPTIIGAKEDPSSVQLLKIEKIERYTPRAKTHLAPPLDFTEILRENVLARARALSVDPANEGLVLVAYGDATYEKEWIELLTTVGQYVHTNTGIGPETYAWCGHLVHYDPTQTTKAIEKILAEKKRAVVIPVLVAYDEMFQIKIIGGGIANVTDNKERVAYKPDSILPDAHVERWVIDITDEFARKIGSVAR